MLDRTKRVFDQSIKMINDSGSVSNISTRRFFVFTAQTNISGFKCSLALTTLKLIILYHIYCVYLLV